MFTKAVHVGGRLIHGSTVPYIQRRLAGRGLPSHAKPAWRWRYGRPNKHDPGRRRLGILRTQTGRDYGRSRRARCHPKTYGRGTAVPCRVKRSPATRSQATGGVGGTGKPDADHRQRQASQRDGRVLPRTCQSEASREQPIAASVCGDSWYAAAYGDTFGYIPTRPRRGQYRCIAYSPFRGARPCGTR